MNVIDQNSALNSLDNALVPAPSLIDGRTEQDRLCFLSEFASLINFYDNNNNINGNWTPFLLKDPVFLLAAISKTRFSEFHTLYLDTCLKLKQLLEPQLNELVTDNKNAISISFNQLFDQLTRIFMHIKRWIYYMQKSGDDYDLKSYVTNQTKANFSRYFWAIISLRQNLFLSSLIQGIEPVDPTRFELFDYHEEIIWKQNKDKSPFWEILGLSYPIKKNTGTDFFNALTKAGDSLFSFFQTIIHHSNAEFEKLKFKKSKYPDTTLLRTFVNLLQIQQDQLNGISQKHLEFYYKDILKQAELDATPDNVFICATLAKPGATFDLLAGTLFNAGLDALKNPIWFAATEDVNLNPGVITGAYTLACLPVSANLSSFYLQNITTPGVLQKDGDGKILAWDTFGGSATAPATLVKTGVAFASPILLLREGIRNISLSFEYTGVINLDMLKNASYYLSTQKAWLSVAPVFQPGITDLTCPVTIGFYLDATAPPIEAFLVNPDGLVSAWPMLKIEFSSVADPSSPPVLSSLTIGVTASGVQTFQLYNDYGVLSTKTPYQLFGPAPLVNSGFIIGSNEIFSKPVDSLCMEVDWSNLPPDFSVYYQQYNDFIANNLITPVSLFKRLIKGVVNLSKGIAKLFTGFINWIKNLFKSEPAPSPAPVVGEPFNNSCFAVNFQVLQNQTWSDINMLKQTSCSSINNTSPAGSPVTPIALFNTDANGKFPGPGFFSCGKISGPNINFVGDPNIQNTPLKFIGTSTSGFIKMTLKDPADGFGSGLYPSLVYQVALDNALLLYKSSGPPFNVAPVLPFVPKVTSLTATYSASKTYVFNPDIDKYPIQCFLYSPFENYPVYDSSIRATDYSYNIGDPTSGPNKAHVGIPLFPVFNYKGFLFLGLENLIPSNAINLYFELARKYVLSSASAGTGYYCLSENGWKELSVLSDGTNNFNCSGVIKVNVPGDITNAGAVMPAKKYWLSIAVKNDPATFAQTVFLTANGFETQRTGPSFLSDTEAPKLLSGAITKPQTAIPQIATIVQPFPSFGGRAAEDQIMMNQRVSNRLKTKDRAVSSEDYFRLIRQEYPDVYYSKMVFHPGTKSTTIYVAKTYASWTDPNAFVPLVNACKEEEIMTFLSKRTAVFLNISVSNFDLQYVKITATVLIKQGFEFQGVQQNINQQLNIFLSPWIATNTPQVLIDQEISDAKVAKFIKTIAGVLDVENVSFQTWMASDQIDLENNNIPLVQTISPLTNSALFISYMNHNIQCN